MSADEAMAHPYLSEFHGTDEVKVLSKPIKIVIDDNVKFSVADYRGALYDEIRRRKKEIQALAKKKRRHTKVHSSIRRRPYRHSMSRSRLK